MAFSLPFPFSITRFVFFLSKVLLNGASLLSLAKSVYYVTSKFKLLSIWPKSLILSILLIGCPSKNVSSSSVTASAFLGLMISS